MSLRDFNNYVNQPLSLFSSNAVASNLLKLALIMYGGLAAPKMSQKYETFFRKPYIRVAVMGLIIWTVDYDVGLSIVLAVVFILSIGKWSPEAARQPKKQAKVVLASGKGITSPEQGVAQVADGPQAFVPDDVMMLASADQ